MFSVKGKVVVVTGAASGIGEAIATAFAEQGASVYAADRNTAGVGQVADRLVALKSDVTAVTLDVTSEEQAEHVIQEIVSKAGRIDVLINNAGIGMVGSILETSGADFDRMISVNVRGVFNLSKAVLPSMIARRSGSIINMASVAGVVGIRDRLAYSTTKFAVVGLTKCMALDHAGSGIRVNCICPGRVETPFVQARLKEYADPEVAYRDMSSTQLFGRMIQPAEIAAAAVYLASDEAGMVTGTSFMIECGWTAGK